MILRNGRYRTFVVAALAAVSLGGCKVSEGTTGAKQNVVKETISISSQDDFNRYTERVLLRQNYLVYRQESSSEFYLETDWKIRLPTETELARGISEARTKVILRGRPYMRGEYSQTPLFTILFEGITEYRKAGAQEWIMLEYDESGREIIKKVAFELKSEMAGRRYDL